MSGDRRTELLETIYVNINNINKYYTDISEINNTSPITVTTINTLLSAANDNRTEIIIQNLNTRPVMIKLGPVTSMTDYNIILSPDLDVRHGGGGSITLKNYTGSISAICEVGSSIVGILEMEVSG